MFIISISLLLIPQVELSVNYLLVCCLWFCGILRCLYVPKNILVITLCKKAKHGELIVKIIPHFSVLDQPYHSSHTLYMSRCQLLASGTYKVRGQYTNSCILSIIILSIYKTLIYKSKSADLQKNVEVVLCRLKFGSKINNCI